MMDFNTFSEAVRRVKHLAREKFTPRYGELEGAFGQDPRERRQEEKGELSVKLRALKENKTAARATSDERIEKIISSFGEILRQGDPEKVRMLLGTFISRIEADKYHALVKYTFPQPGGFLDLGKCPQRNSNPCRHLERVVS